MYVTQVPGFEVDNKKDSVNRLYKALYGLKQAPRAWNKKVDSFFIQNGFKRCKVEHGVYVKHKHNQITILICVYVDDLLITGGSNDEIRNYKNVMLHEFDMTDLGRMSYFLGMEQTSVKGGMILHQCGYATEVLKRFDMFHCNSAVTPADQSVKLLQDDTEEDVDPTLYKHIVGSLRYLCHSRPDIGFAVGLVSMFMVKPKMSHFLAGKRIMRYIKGTIRYGLFFPINTDQKSLVLCAFSDSDWCGDKVDRRSTTRSSCSKEQQCHGVLRNNK